MADLPITNLTSLQIAAPIDSDTGIALSNSVGQGGFAVAQMTDAQMNALTTPDPVTGEVAFGLGTMVYNTDIGAFFAYQGGAWVQAVEPMQIGLPVNVTTFPPAAGNVITIQNTNNNLITSLENTPVVIGQNGNITGVNTIVTPTYGVTGINNGGTVITTQANGANLDFNLPSTMGAANAALITTDGNGTLGWNPAVVSFTPNVTPIAQHQVAVFSNAGDGLHVSGAINTANANSAVILNNLTLQAIQSDPRLLARRANVNALPSVFGIQELEFIDFPNGGYLTVNELQFITLNYGAGSTLQNILITDDQTSVAPTSLNALLEIRSTNTVLNQQSIDIGAAALLLPGRTHTDIMNMNQAQSGMIMYDNTEEALIVYSGGNRDNPLGNDGAWGYPILGNPNLAGIYTNPKIIIGAQGQITQISAGFITQDTIVGVNAVRTFIDPIISTQIDIDLVQISGVSGNNYVAPTISVNGYGQIIAISSTTQVVTVPTTTDIGKIGDIAVWANTGLNYVIQDSAINISGRSISSSDGSSAISLQGDLVSIDVTGNVTLTSDGASGSGSLIMVGQAGGKINIQVNTDQATSDDFIFTLPNNAPSDGDVLQIDSNGNTVWGVAEGIGNVTVASGASVTVGGIATWSQTSNSSYTLQNTAGFVLDNTSTLNTPNGIKTAGVISTTGTGSYITTDSYLQTGTGLNSGYVLFNNDLNTQSYTLGINGPFAAPLAFNLPTNFANTAGYFLQTDGNGNTSWQPGGGGGGAVTKIVAGNNITISPVDGTGVVTINATNGGSGMANFFTASVATTSALQSTYNNGTNGIGAYLIQSTTTITPVAASTATNLPLYYNQGDNGGPGDTLTNSTVLTAYAITVINLTVGYNNGTNGVGATLTNTGPLGVFMTDGTTPPINSIILVQNQFTNYQNGLYMLTTVGSSSVYWVLTRLQYYDNPIALMNTNVLIQFGTTYGGTNWYENLPITSIGNGNSIGYTVYSYSTLMLDGFTVLAQQTVLIQNQINPAWNGIYTVTSVGSSTTSWVLVRTSGINLYSTAVYVVNGTQKSGNTYYVTSPINFIGTSPINYALYSYNQLIVDGMNSSVASTVLVKNQTSPAQNGLYNVTSSGDYVLVVAAQGTTGAFGVVYNNGNNGVGATLVANSNRIFGILDGVNIAVGQQILVQSQTPATYNGIYTLTQEGNTLAPYILTRTPGYDNIGALNDLVVIITGGTLYNGMFSQQTATVTAINVSPITFSTNSSTPLINPWILTRATNYNAPSEAIGGNVVGVVYGSTQASTAWQQITTPPAIADALGNEIVFVNTDTVQGTTISSLPYTF